MRKPNRHACVIAFPLPAAAWFMAPIEPNLAQRMLNELSEPPATAIKD